MNFVEKIEKLPEDIKKYFISNKPRLALEKSCFLFSIPEEVIQDISGPIGLIFVGDIKLENLPHIIWENLHLEKPQIYGLAYEINKRLFNKFPEYFKDSGALLDQWSRLKSNPIISEDEAWKKVLEIEPWIMEEEESQQPVRTEETPAYKIASENISLIEALKKYPNISEQTITSNNIKSKNYQDPIRPSVKNWLSDYTANLGYENHTSMERGNYLFQSENTRNLSYQDRQKLSQILKSFDEKSPLNIDVATKQIVFSESVPEKKVEARIISNSQFPISNDPISKPLSSINTQNINYQPKTQEPGNNFEKVIGLPKKEEKTAANPRVVNLKEKIKEKPPVPTGPQPKNLLNIKELIDQSRREREESTQNTYSIIKPASQSAESAPLKNDWPDNLHESLDETEKNLFQKNNALDEGNIKFSSSQKLPYEKEQEKIEKTPINPTKPATPQDQPYRIHSSSF